MKRKRADSFSNIQDLLAEIVHGLDGGQIKELAAELECTREAIYKMASPNCPEKRFNLIHTVAIAKVSGDPRLAEFFAWKAGLWMVAVPQVEGEDSCVDQALKDLTESWKDLLYGHVDARSPEGPGGSGLTVEEKFRQMEKAMGHLKEVILYHQKVGREKAVDEA